MDKFLFADGEGICLFEDGKISKFESKFIKNYKDTATNSERLRRWKHNGEGAQFRGDVRRGEDDISFNVSLNGIFTYGDEALYSFKINETSGIYRYNLIDEKAPEVHVINSVDREFGGGCLDAEGGMLAVSIKRNYYNSDIAVFELDSGNYYTVTDGDTMDEDPFFDPDNGNIIYFSSRGVGRDSEGAFAGWSPSAICRLDLSAMDVKEVAVSDKFSYYKPVVHNGKLYAIKAPAKEKKPNPVIEILLIPVRIVQAIANFINVFVRAFTGKSLASGGSNPAKGRDYDSRKEYVRGNLINVEKEMKRNAGKRSSDYGFIPHSWQLVEVESGEVIRSGVGDFDILSDGTFITTDGKHIFAIKDGKSTKICNTEKCLKVSCRHSSKKRSDPFVF